jgi:hypothetical protein
MIKPTPLLQKLSQGFLTQTEIEHGLKLQARFEHFEKEFQRYNPETLRRKKGSAQSRFIDNPTAKNAAALEAAVRARRDYDISHKVFSAARVARKQFLKTEVTPWALPIVDRALKIALQELERVTAEETARTVELTGSEPTTPSPVAEEYRRTANMLDRLHRGYTHMVPQPRSPVSVLHLFGHDAEKAITSVKSSASPKRTYPKERRQIFVPEAARPAAR